MLAPRSARATQYGVIISVANVRSVDIRVQTLSEALRGLPSACDAAYPWRYVTLRCVFLDSPFCEARTEERGADCGAV